VNCEIERTSLKKWDHSYPATSTVGDVKVSFQNIKKRRAY